MLCGELVEPLLRWAMSAVVLLHTAAAAVESPPEHYIYNAQRQGEEGVRRGPGRVQGGPFVWEGQRLQWPYGVRAFHRITDRRSEALDAFGRAAFVWAAAAALRSKTRTAGRHRIRQKPAKARWAASGRRFAPYAGFIGQ